MAWLPHNASSPHAAEARTTLDGAMPKITALKDEATWSAANVDACKAAATTDSCSGVHDYLARFPSGAHASEANAILDKSQPRIDAIQKVADQKAAQAEKAQQQDACKEDCRTNQCSWRSARYDLCVNLCVARVCR